MIKAEDMDFVTDIAQIEADTYVAIPITLS